MNDIQSGNLILLCKIDYSSKLPDIYIRHYSALNSIASDHQRKLESLPTINCEWHIGPTGCGKSRTVREKYPDAYIKDCEPKRTHFWGGYQGESVVICEDVDIYNVAMGRQLKTWCDHYPFPVEAKYKGTQLIRPHTIIVTSNWEIRDIWSDARTYEPLERRFKIIRYNERGVIDERARVVEPPLFQRVRDPNPTRSDLNAFEVQQAILEDPYIDLTIDESCKRSTPDHSQCEYSQ